MSKRKTYVYFIQAIDDHTGKTSGPIKIGFSNNVKKRLKSLQVGNPNKLKILRKISGSKRLEKRFHRHFGWCRLYGEWFNPTQELLNVINCKSIEIVPEPYPKIIDVSIKNKNITKHIVLTHRIMNDGKSINGSWNMKQLSYLGINKLYKGWKKSIIGKKFKKQEIDNFLLLKNSHIKYIKYQ